MSLPAEAIRMHARGPVTAAGKATSSLNALKTGLTGRTVLLHSDDRERYQTHVSEYEDEYQPVGLRERELVQSLADTQWRLARIASLEMAIYAQGRAANLHNNYLDETPETAAHLIDLDIYLKFEKQLRNLQLQEARLLRRYEKERKELLGIQSARKTSAAASAAATSAKQAPAQAPVSHSGFEFSNGSKSGSAAQPGSPSTLENASLKSEGNPLH